MQKKGVQQLQQIFTWYHDGIKTPMGLQFSISALS